MIESICLFIFALYKEDIRFQLRIVLLIQFKDMNELSRDRVRAWFNIILINSSLIESIKFKLELEFKFFCIYYI